LFTKISKNSIASYFFITSSFGWRPINEQKQYFCLLPLPIFFLEKKGGKEKREVQTLL